MPIYEPIDENRAKMVVRHIDMTGRKGLAQTYNLAIDYLEGRQLDHVRNELNARFESSMQLDPGQAIQPVVMPMVDRYVAEAANAYNKPVERKLVGDDGTENSETEAATKAYAEMLEEAKYDEVMHRNEHITVLLRASVTANEAKRGSYRASVRYPQDVYPVPPETPAFVEAADPDDYEAFVVELGGATKGVNNEKGMRTYALYTNAEIQFWTGESPDKLSKRLSAFPNPYKWEQTIEDVDYSTGSRTVRKAVVPGRMLTFWHMRYPLDGLIPRTDPDIVAANQELNIAWSALLDTIKLQGHAVPVIKQSSTKGDSKAKRRYGARWPLILRVDESFELASAQASYSEQVEVLKTLVKMLATFKRQSPSDFSLDSAAAVSGFSKIVDSLPKIEAREERIRRLKAIEEQDVWPRQRAIGLVLGKLPPSVSKMKLRVKFADVEFPMSEDERAKRLETDTKYNFTTPAQELAERAGITLDEAQKRIAENAAINDAMRQSAMQAMPQPGAAPGAGQPARFGGLVGRTSRNGDANGRSLGEGRTQ